jgi:hypothetical protein
VKFVIEAAFRQEQRGRDPLAQMARKIMKHGELNKNGYRNRLLFEVRFATWDVCGAGIIIAGRPTAAHDKTKLSRHA